MCTNPYLPPHPQPAPASLAGISQRLMKYEFPISANELYLAIPGPRHPLPSVPLPSPAIPSHPQPSPAGPTTASCLPPQVRAGDRDWTRLQVRRPENLVGSRELRDGTDGDPCGGRCPTLPLPKARGGLKLHTVSPVRGTSHGCQRPLGSNLVPKVPSRESLLQRS